VDDRRTQYVATTPRHTKNRPRVTSNQPTDYAYSVFCRHLWNRIFATYKTNPSWHVKSFA